MPRSAKKPTNPQAPNMQSAQPVKVPTGLPYGEATQLAQQQRQVPLPGGAGAAGPAGPPVGGAGGPGHIDSAVAAIAAHGLPAAGGFGDPSSRPGEPVTSGLSTGPGPGPEALQPTPQVPSPLAQGAAILNALGNRIDPETRRLRDYINALIGNMGAP